MRSRRLILAVAALALALLAGGWLLLRYSPEVTLTFTQAQLQSQIEPKFPKRKCLLSACVELTDPRVTLTEGTDRIGIDASFVATLGSRAMPGIARFTGRPHYEQGSGSFYLKDVEVVEFKMSGNAPDFDEVVKVRGPGIVAAIMNQFPLYSVQSHPNYGSLAKLALRSVRVEQSQLQVVFANPLLLLGR
jgi:hypothetical protein